MTAKETFSIPSPFGPTTRTEMWMCADVLCPKCGSGLVYKEEDLAGDYYVGELYICIECESGFYLPNGVFPVSDYSKIRCESLKAYKETKQ